MIGNDGTYFGRLWDFRNITEHNQAIAALRVSEEKYSTIYNQSPIAIEFYDANGSLIEMNKACLETFGVVDKNEMSGIKLFKNSNISDEIKARLSDGGHARFESEFNFEEVKRLDLYTTAKTGRLFLDWHITPLINNESGKLVGYMAQIQDITDRVKVGQELKDRQERYLQVFKTSANCIFVTSLSGKLLDFNDATMRMFGYTDWKELIKVNISALYIHPEDRESHLKHIQQNGGHAEDFPVRFKCKDGSITKTLITTIAVKRPDGSTKEFVGSVRVVE
jgi:PAS domain S-box-containing protein